MSLMILSMLRKGAPQVCQDLDPYCCGCLALELLLLATLLLHLRVIYGIPLPIDITSIPSRSDFYAYLGRYVMFNAMLI